jgi:hypothetical protein
VSRVYSVELVFAATPAPSDSLACRARTYGAGVDATKAELGGELGRIRSEHPGALTQAPGPSRIQDQPLPMTIVLAAWAEPIARGLHDRFGPNVDLAVGLLKFPSREPRRPQMPTGEIIPPWPDDIEVNAIQPLRVRSGHHLDAAVTLFNNTGQLLLLSHPGGERSLYGVVVDPVSGEVVNGHVGWAPLTADATTAVAAGSTQELKLRLYTDSRLPQLGYALPAGPWAVQPRLNLVEGGRRYSAPIPLTITT